MAHRLIPLTPPLFFHFTLPLKNEKCLTFSTKVEIVFMTHFLFSVQEMPLYLPLHQEASPDLSLMEHLPLSYQLQVGRQSTKQTVS
jgi:hypothetical protein